MKKKIILINILICFIISITNICLASFADFDDEAARKETEKLVEEQEKNEQQAVDKSNNNYLSSLSVENYKLTPEFDKQTQEYKIEENLNTNKIKINAVLDDSRAKVSGDGLVELKNGENRLRIDVTSERGSVRTYFINVNFGNVETQNNTTEENQEVSVNIEEQQSIENTTQDNYNIENEQNNNENNNSENKYVIIAIGCLAIILVIVLILLKKKTKRRYKSGKRYR